VVSGTLDGTKKPNAKKTTSKAKPATKTAATKKR
jgi:hypothetical protein